MSSLPEERQGLLSGPGAKPRVVILGAGFGGLNAALALKRAAVEVVVIDRRNYHLFQPLLYQVATAGLSPAQIAQPIRSVLRRQSNATVLMDWVVDVDIERSQVVTRQHRIFYDYLIVATGARHAYFGNDQWEAFAPGLKKIEEATGVRQRILTAFEKAELTDDAAERQRLLTFAVIGGGPTGVEMAGAIAELARKSIVADFRRIDPAQSRIVLIEAGPRILPTFPEKLSQSAERQLEKLGVDVITDDAVVAMDAETVVLASGRRLAVGTAIWAAGVMASPAGKWLKARTDKAGRILTGPDLRLPGFANIFVIGDTASVLDATGNKVPGVAPAAKQMGRHAARSILLGLAHKPETAFRYSDFGNLATIGRKAAVADLGRLKLAGFPAWLLWSFAHIWFLIGFRNRIGVFLDWTFAYVTYDRGARIITGSDG